MNDVILTKEFAEDMIFGLNKLEGFKVTLASLEINDNDFSQCNQSSVFWETSPADCLFYQLKDGMRLIYLAPDDPLKLQYFSYIFYYDRISTVDGTRTSYRAFFIRDNTTMVNGLNGLVLNGLVVPTMTTYTGPADSLKSSPVSDPQLLSINQIITEDSYSIGDGTSLFDDGLLPNACSHFGYDTQIHLQVGGNGVNNLFMNDLYLPIYALEYK